MDFSYAQPLWGIIGSSNSTPTGYASVDNISTISQESLYLPGYMDSFYFLYGGYQANLPGSAGQNLPGVDFYSKALSIALNIASPCVAGYQGLADYSGMTSLALFAKWQNLSWSAATAPAILNLVWTDAAANAVVGTKGWGLTPGNDQQVLVPVTVYQRTISYRLPFAIPAFIVLTVTIIVLVTLIGLTLMQKTGLARMRALLDATSAGRIIGTALWPEKRTGRGTRAWIAVVGTHGVRITSDGIFTEGESLVEDPEQERGVELQEGADTNVSEIKSTTTSKMRRRWILESDPTFVGSRSQT